jgi:hypothetical protein
MTFTRRRWDAWCLVLAGVLAFGAWLNGRGSPLVGLIPFWLLRFRIPAQGFSATPIRRLSPASRRLIAWGVLSLPLSLAATVLAPRNLEAWWICPIAAGAHMAVTFRLARRVDLERAASRV